MVHLGPLGGLTGGTSKREVLRLYREILRTANAFYWPNDEGEPWSAVLKRSARKEFEQARHEKDPLIVARLVVVGQQCVNETRNRFNDMEEEIKNRRDLKRGAAWAKARTDDTFWGLGFPAEM